MSQVFLQILQWKLSFLSPIHDYLQNKRDILQAGMPARTSHYVYNTRKFRIVSETKRTPWCNLMVSFGRYPIKEDFGVLGYTKSFMTNETTNIGREAVLQKKIIPDGTNQAQQKANMPLSRIACMRVIRPTENFIIHMSASSESKSENSTNSISIPLSTSHDADNNYDAYMSDSAETKN